ncbi:MAG: chaperone [unclassified Hahellaceae]|mgnify:CR=1 FL=1|nr:chaperone [Hahellaceae bacterium]
MLREAIEQLGGPKRVSELLDCSPQAVCKWMSTQIPAERAIQLENVTNGSIKCRDLRPDLYPNPTSETQAA